MQVLLAGIAVGAVLGLLRGGRPAGLAGLRLRVGWLFLLALLVQVAAVRLARDPWVPLRVTGWLLLGSQLLVLLGVWPNRSLPGLWLVALGVGLNLLAAVPHGGWMPTTPEALRMAGRPVPAVLPADGERPYVLSKDVVLPREQVPLWDISDRFVVPAGWPLAGVFSPGDVAIGAGVAWLVASAISGRSNNRLLRPLSAY